MDARTRLLTAFEQYKAQRKENVRTGGASGGERRGEREERGERGERGERRERRREEERGERVKRESASLTRGFIGEFGKG